MRLKVGAGMTIVLACCALLEPALAAEHPLPTGRVTLTLSTPIVTPLVTLPEKTLDNRRFSWLWFGDTRPTFREIVFSRDYTQYLLQISERKHSWLPYPRVSDALRLVVIRNGNPLRESFDWHKKLNLRFSWSGDHVINQFYDQSDTRNVTEIYDQQGKLIDVPRLYGLSKDNDHWASFGVTDPNWRVMPVEEEFYQDGVNKFRKPGGGHKFAFVPVRDQVMLFESRPEGVYVNNRFIAEPPASLISGYSRNVGILSPHVNWMDGGDGYALYVTCAESGGKRDSDCLRFDLIVNGQRVNDTPLPGYIQAIFSEGGKNWVAFVERNDFNSPVVDDHYQHYSYLKIKSQDKTDWREKRKETQEQSRKKWLAESRLIAEEFAKLTHFEPHLLFNGRRLPLLGTSISFVLNAGQPVVMYGARAAQWPHGGQLVVQWDDGEVWKSPVVENGGVIPLGFGRDYHYIAYLARQRVIINGVDGPRFEAITAVTMHPEDPIATYLASTRTPVSDPAGKNEFYYGETPFYDRVVIGEHTLQGYDEYWPPRFVEGKQAVVYAARKGREVYRIEQPYTLTRENTMPKQVGEQ